MAIMNPTPLEVARIEFPEAQITWAGEYPIEGGYCFGTEDGDIWLANDDFEISKGPFHSSDRIGSINGVAFTPGLMALSTPEQIVFGRLDHASLTGDWNRYEGGAHGIIATPNDGVMAPLGQSGLLLFEPDAQGKYRRGEFTPQDGLYYYKLACLGTSDENESVFVCACREGGIIVLALQSGRESGRIAVHARLSSYCESYDIVDVSGLNSKSHPFAAIGLSIDNSLHFSPDILHQRFRTFRFRAINGTAYSVFASGGHIFILTSESIYACVGLADRLLSGEDLGGGNAVSRLDVNVIEGFLAYGKYLLLVEAGAVKRLDLEMWSKLPSFRPDSKESAFELDSTGLGPPTDHSFQLIRVA